MKKQAKKRGPKAQDYNIIVRLSEKKLTEIEIARLEKIFTSMLVNAEEEDAYESKPESSNLLSRLVG